LWRRVEVEDENEDEEWWKKRGTRTTDATTKCK
jgi:hypothetical protein